jgi:hypothetical protein
MSEHNSENYLSTDNGLPEVFQNREDPLPQDYLAGNPLSKRSGPFHGIGEMTNPRLHLSEEYVSD